MSIAKAILVCQLSTRTGVAASKRSIRVFNPDLIDYINYVEAEEKGATGWNSRRGLKDNFPGKKSIL